MCVFVLIFMIFFSFYRVQWTGISLYWLQFFYVPTTELEGLLWYPVIFTGSLQGRITTQGDPCNRYREWVCSVVKGLRVQKWLLINWLKIPQMPQHLSAQIVCPSAKVWDFHEKRLHWASVVMTTFIEFMMNK